MLQHNTREAHKMALTVSAWSMCVSLAELKLCAPEQVQLLPKPSVITHCGLLIESTICIQLQTSAAKIPISRKSGNSQVHAGDAASVHLLLCLPCCAINALQHGLSVVAPPVCTCNKLIWLSKHLRGAKWPPPCMSLRPPDGGIATHPPPTQAPGHLQKFRQLCQREALHKGPTNGPRCQGCLRGTAVVGVTFPWCVNFA